MAQYDFFKAKKITLLGRWAHRVFNQKIQAYFDGLGTLSNLKFLELGTGKGYIADRIIESGAEYTGYEPSESLYLQGKNKGYRLRKKFAPPLDEKDNCIDVIVLSHVLEHLPNLSDATALLIEIKRVLKPEGRALIIVPDFADMKDWFYEGDYTHQLPLTFFKLRHMLEDAGLSVDEQRFIWGSWSWMPGYFINVLVKIVYFCLDPLINLIYPKFGLISKLRTTFARCIWVEVRKI